MPKQPVSGTQPEPASGTRRESISELLKLLSSADEEERWEAAKALTQRGKRALRGCVRIVNQHNSHPGRLQAVYTVSSLFDLESLDFLLGLLADRSEEPEIRAQAAEGLGNLCHFMDRRLRVYHRASSALRKALGDKHAEVRFWAAFALGCMREKNALALLDTLAASDQELCPGWWSVAQEAADVALYIRTGEWPDRDQVSPSSATSSVTE